MRKALGQRRPPQKHKPSTLEGWRESPSAPPHVGPATYTNKSIENNWDPVITLRKRDNLIMKWTKRESVQYIHKC